MVLEVGHYDRDDVRLVAARRVFPELERYLLRQPNGGLYLTRRCVVRATVARVVEA